MGGIAGASAVTLQLAAPLKSSYLSVANIRAHGLCSINNAGSLDTLAKARIDGTSSLIIFDYQTTVATATATLTNAQQNNASRSILGSINYQAF